MQDIHLPSMWGGKSLQDIGASEMILGTGAKKSNSNYCTFVAVVLLLLCLCVSSSWAVCWTIKEERINGRSLCNECSGGPMSLTSSCPACGSGQCEAIAGDGWRTNCKVSSVYWADGGQCFGSGYPSYALCDVVYCDGGSNPDSALCDLFPDSPKCENACTAYQNECESHGGVWEGSLTSDTTCASTCDLCGTPESQAMREYIYNSCCEGGLTPQYSCGFPGGPSSISGMVYSDVFSMGCNTSNWETQKICNAFYDESSSSQNSSSSIAQSSSSVSEYCLLFPTDLACICADNPDNPDCAYLSSNSSSDSQEPGSSGGGGDTSSDSGGGGTPASSGSGGVLGDDWEYDYRDSLHRIINATTRTASNTQAIEENTGAIASILRAARCLFTDCTNYDQLKISLDSNIVIPDGDTAGVIGSMSPLDSSMMEMLDAAANGDINGIGPESLQTALLDFGDKVGGLYGDSSGIKNDMEQFGQTIQNHFPTAQWSYTGACPAALNKTISFNLPLVGNVDSGKKLGGYICEPLPTLGVTLGSTVRDIVRLVVTIFMAFGIFKAATGLKHE